MAHSTTAAQKPNLNWIQIFNMSVGFFGIQHGFEIQFARMTPLFKTLGAGDGEIPMLWLAAPLTGFLIQPIIGYMSDRTWWPSWRARRRPYFFVGSLLAALALIAMPHSGAVWMAAGLLWVLDASLNICMEPMRAFVGDRLNSNQRPRGYAWQALMIGVGTITGNFIASQTDMQTGFTVCGVILFLGMMWTVFNSPEYPPDDMVAFTKNKESARGLLPSVADYFRETFSCLVEMPKVMRVLAGVQFLTWMGLFCMWIFYSDSVGIRVFGGDPSAAEGSPLRLLYDEGVRFAALTLTVRGLATPFYAVLIPVLCRYIGRAATHSLSLFLGCAGFLTVAFVTNRDETWLLYFFALGAGIAWASVVSMPYTILVEHLPKEKLGLFMGLFNMFIVIPEIIVALGAGKLMLAYAGGNTAYVVAMGGVLLGLAGLATLFLRKYDLPTAFKTA